VPVALDSASFLPGVQDVSHNSSLLKREMTILSPAAATRNLMCNVWFGKDKLILYFYGNHTAKLILDKIIVLKYAL